MANTLSVDPDGENLGWLIFVDRRPVVDFNRDLKALLNLSLGHHRLVVDTRGSGSEIKVSIDGGAVLNDPAGGWPLTISVPKTMAGKIVVADFSI